MAAVIDDRLARVFEYFDDHVLGKMDGRNLMVAAGILTDKRQLLKGEPTAITRYEDMRKLDDFLEEVSKELKRRGAAGEVIDVTPEGAVGAGPPEDAT